MDPNKRSSPKDIPIIKTNHANKRIPIGEEKQKMKTGSSFDVSSTRSHRDELLVDELPRRRSHSVPLSLAASAVATKLKDASDSFQTKYEKRNSTKKRRNTVSSLHSDENRLSWPAWNPNITEEDEPVLVYSSSLPTTGTNV